MELSSGQDAASTFRDDPETTLWLLEKYRKVVVETLPSSGRARSGRGSFRCVSVCLQLVHDLCNG